MTISIYDMDRTITRRGTWVPWLVFWVRREAPWRIILLPALGLALAAYAAKLINRARLKEWGHRLMMGRRVVRSRLTAAADAFATKIIAEEVFPGALIQIAADRSAGRRLALATASNEFYVAAIAARLGIDDVIATPARWEEERLHHRLGGDNCYGEAKRALVSVWLTRHDLEGQAVVFYSDHESDLPMFEMAVAGGGEAVATNPSPALRAIADARGWRVVEWGEMIKSVFERA